MSILPQGEDLRKAVKWISEELKDNSEKPIAGLIQSSCLKFNLSPKDAEFLNHFYKDSVNEDTNSSGNTV